MSGIIKVNILGEDYPIRSSSDPEYIKRVAAFVNEKMEGIRKSVSGMDAKKIAILAALNIADEYFRLQNKNEKSVEELGHKIVKLMNAIDSKD